MPTPSTTSPPAAAETPAASTDLRRLLHHSSIYAVGSILNRLGVFLLLPVYTNYLSVAEYGRLELFYTVAAVASGLLSIGLAHATLRFYFEYDDPAQRRQVVSTNLIVATTIAAAGAVVLLPIRGTISQWVFGHPGEVLGIGIVLLTMVLELSGQIGLAYLRARERSVLFLTAVLTRLVVQVSINTWLVVSAGAGVVGVLVGNCLAVAIGWAIVTTVTVRDCGLAVRWSKAMPVLRYAYPFLLSTIVGLMAANLDRIFIRTLLSFEALGLFALASKFAKLLEELVGLPFSRAYGAFRFSVMHQDNAAELQARITRALLVASLFAGLAVVLFAPDVLALLSDESFGRAGDILPWLVAASIVRVMTYPMQTGILVRKQTRAIFYLGSVSGAIYIVSGYLLLRTFGLVGMCWAMLGAAATTFWLTHRVAQRHFPVQYGVQRWARVVFLALCTYAGAMPLLHAPPLWAIPMKLALLALFAGAVAQSSVFDPFERRMMREWLGTLAARIRPGSDDRVATAEGGGLR